MNDDDLNRTAPLPWYQRAAPWLFLGLPILVILMDHVRIV